MINKTTKNTDSMAREIPTGGRVTCPQLNEAAQNANDMGGFSVRKVVHPSVLDARCPRYYWMIFRQQRREGIPVKSAEVGYSIEEMIVAAIKEKQRTYELDGKRFAIPQVILDADKIEYQREIAWQYNDWWVHGYADLILNDNHIIEIKSAYSLVDYDNWLRQISAYAYPFWKDDTPPQVSIFYARHGVLQDVPRLIPPARLRHIISEIVRTAQNPKEPRGRPSGFCFLCAYCLSCPEYPQIGEMNLDELVDELIKLEAKVKQIRNVLREHTAVYGDINTPVAKVGHFVVDELEVAPSFLNEVLGLGVNPIDSKLINWNKRGVEKLAQQFPQLANLISYVPKTRFSVEVIKGGRAQDSD